MTPATSYGFDLIRFADEVLGEPLDPWQRWLSMHVGELLPDGRPRFRIVVILVARQNGKTHWAKTLTKFWLFVERVPLVLATSTNREYAKESWRQVCAEVMANPWLVADTGPGAVRATIGEEQLQTAHGCRYRIAASNRRAGRSLTVHRLLVDELREHKDFSAWDAATNAMNAVPGGQVVTITNQGDVESVVLDSLREPALTYIETGEGDPRLGLFEWSAPDGADVEDPEALAAANPDLGNRIQLDTLAGAAKRAKMAGGVELAGFRTEVLCQRVHMIDAAIDEHAWASSATSTPIDMAPLREGVALAVDVSLDGSHATVCAAVEDGGLVHVEIVAAWDGHGCTARLRRELPALVRRVRPRVVGWFPSGPAAAVTADMRAGWAPKGTEVTDIKGETTAVCMGFAEQVTAGEVRHPGDPLLDAHVASTQRLKRGDAWVFTRRGAQPVDATYAAAGAVHLCRTLPAPRPPLHIA